MIFVFGSNLAGIHGAGAAKFARLYHGAQLKVGEGITGNSYALPTKDAKLKRLPLTEIKKHVEKFIEVSKSMPNELFVVSRVACGLAGYKNKDIAPMFKDAPDNCLLPGIWSDMLGHKRMHVVVVSDPENIQEELPSMEGVMFVVEAEAKFNREHFSTNLVVSLNLQPDKYGEDAGSARIDNMVWMANQLLIIKDISPVLKQKMVESGVDMIDSVSAIKSKHMTKPPEKSNLEAEQKDFLSDEINAPVEVKKRFKL